MVKKNSENEEGDLITVQEAAALKGVSKVRIHQWIDSGRLTKEVKFGRIVLHRDEVLNLEPLTGGRPSKSKK